MRRIRVNPLFAFGIILVVGVGATLFIVRTISQTNFEYAQYQSIAGV